MVCATEAIGAVLVETLLGWTGESAAPFFFEADASLAGRV